MKRIFPVLYGKASTIVAMPLILFTTIYYVSSAMNQWPAEVYTIAVAAFGVTGALSGICFTVSESVDGSSTIRYAGEKFLHSSLLLVQTVMIIYIKDALIASAWFSEHPWISSCATTLIVALLLLLSTTAAVAWFFGFDALNSQLWQNWERRIENIDRGASTNESANSAKSKSAP